MFSSVSDLEKRIVSSLAARVAASIMAANVYFVFKRFVIQARVNALNIYLAGSTTAAFVRRLWIVCGLLYRLLYGKDNFSKQKKEVK